MKSTIEDYPGQSFYHEHNPRIRAAELKALGRSSPVLNWGALSVLPCPEYGRVEVDWPQCKKCGAFTTYNESRELCMKCETTKGKLALGLFLFFALLGMFFLNGCGKSQRLGNHRGPTVKGSQSLA
jgi:hypothetical protein